MKILRNLFVTFFFLALATLFCFMLRPLNTTDTYVPLIYVLAVLCISRFTTGYIYGVCASIIAVVGVNYIFTYPYFQVDFTLTGYPLTFLVMLAVSIFISALTTQIKHQEQIRLEVEREKMRANLLRAVSHDIRTPLTSIAGSAAGIIENRDKLTDQQELELLENIREEAQWMVRMVENLLSITRFNSGEAQINTIDEVAEDVISCAVVKFSKRFPDIKVTVDIPEEVLLVPMDATLIEQVIINLFENAAIHGKDTSEISIRLTSTPYLAVFFVEDNGQGIDPKVLPHIFEGNITSSDQENSDNKRNMGIGLSVCREIITAHHGTMKAENREEGGARFIFTLPLRTEQIRKDQ